MSAGTTFRGASETLKLLGVQFDNKSPMRAYDLAKQHDGTFGKINKILEIAAKQNRFDIDLHPVIVDLEFVPTVVKFVKQAAAG